MAQGLGDRRVPLGGTVGSVVADRVCHFAYLTTRMDWHPDYKETLPRDSDAVVSHTGGTSLSSEGERTWQMVSGGE